MRLFLVFCSWIALACAKPQGYNYGSGVSGVLSGVGAGTGLGVGGYNIGTGGGAHGGFLTAPSNVGSSAAHLSSGGFSTGGFNIGATQHQQHQQQFQQGSNFEATAVHKQFITFSAPEDHDTLEKSKHLVIGRPQKNYRVVFIKAPSSSSANVKLSAEYAPQEEKTVIYVLTKKDSSLEVNDIATPEPTKPTKPEVFFIKYKTEEEAQHAQRQIQAEYDKIEGTSEHADGGVAQQQSVEGILGDGGAATSAIGGAGGLGAGIGGGLGGGFSTGSLGGSSGFATSASNLSGARSPTYLPPGK